jgi:hypothetical protein
MRKKKGYIAMLIITIFFTLMAVSTMIPISFASKECLLGYKAHCTFTPVSTAICLLLAGLACVIRSRLFIERRR